MSPPTCAGKVYGGSSHGIRGVIERNGRWYCKIHDPEAVAARRKAWITKHASRRHIEESIKAEGNKLAVRLGTGATHYQGGIWGGWQSALVIPFKDVETIIARLGDIPITS